MVRRTVPAVALAFIVGGLWWWAVLRLVLAPADSGPLEGAVAVGGWGLSLLPVHVAALPGGGRAAVRRARSTRPARATRAWRRRRSGAGSGRS
ncbi:hypothetical protein OG917_25735 [Streptomyces sp. NBC_00388]